jgi:EpsG family
MTGTTVANPIALIGGERGEALVGTLFMALLCVLLYLLVNPFLATFLLAVISLRWNVPKYVFLLMATLSFTMMFYLREYGVEWYPGISGDDIPTYLGMYADNYGLTLSELFARFVGAPNGNEILWHVPWWFLLNYLNGSEDTFILLHYLAVFGSLFVAMRCLSRKYWIVLTVVYFFLTPLSIDGIAHVWRQQMAFAIFVAGVGLQYSRGSRAGGWLMHLAVLVHLSVIFFLFSYWTFLLIRRFGGFDNKLKFTVLIVVLMACVPLLSTVAVRVLDSIGMARILSFFEGYGTDVRRVYLLLLVYAAPMLGAFFWLRTDNVNRLILIMCFAVFSIVLALPSANGVYDRLLMFTLPLMSIYFYRCVLMNFPDRWYAPVLCLIFALGAYRLHVPTREGAGVMSFVAFGHGMDPAMGLMRLLSGL